VHGEAVKTLIYRNDPAVNPDNLMYDFRSADKHSNFSVSLRNEEDDEANMIFGVNKRHVFHEADGDEDDSDDDDDESQ
jgi:hypothetical protein